MSISTKPHNDEGDVTWWDELAIGFQKSNRYIQHLNQVLKFDGVVPNEVLERD